MPMSGVVQVKTPSLSISLHYKFKFRSELVPTLIEVVPIRMKHLSGLIITATDRIFADSASLILIHGTSVPAVC